MWKVGSAAHLLPPLLEDNRDNQECRMSSETYFFSNPSSIVKLSRGNVLQKTVPQLKNTSPVSTKHPSAPRYVLLLCLISRCFSGAMKRWSECHLLDCSSHDQSCVTLWRFVFIVISHVSADYVLTHGRHEATFS